MAAAAAAAARTWRRCVPAHAGSGPAPVNHQLTLRAAAACRRYGIAGAATGDVAAWLFCTQCAMCQEYRTVLGERLENGVWGRNEGGLLETATQERQPGVQMVERV